MRHLKSTLEVCATDFTTYGWVLARDYAKKIDNEVDQKLTTWQDIPAGVKTATLVSAQMENPRPALNTPGTKVVTNEKKELLCTTYNTCKTRESE